MTVGSTKARSLASIHRRKSSGHFRVMILPKVFLAHYGGMAVLPLTVLRLVLVRGAAGWLVADGPCGVR